ncbi:MAG: gamma carbonic anhydrase family protein [Rhodospirillales bacterium]|nr:gamma carbonic anhydrase family protein [Rhodospirillales bacterium]
MTDQQARPAFIHPTALVYGRVDIGPQSSLWPYSVIRAERNAVRIGRCSNIQDFVMIHVGYDHGVTIGDHCSVTHHTTLHGCTIGDRCLIGIGVTIMDGCVIGENSIVAGHSFLRENTVIPPDSIVMGTPGKVVRTADMSLANVVNALIYHRNALAYAADRHRAWESMDLADVEAEAAALLRGEA